MKRENEAWKIVFETYDMESYFKAQNELREQGIKYETKVKTSIFRSIFLRPDGQSGGTYKLAVRERDVGRAGEALRNWRNSV